MVIQMNLNQSQKENQNFLTKPNDKRNESTLNCHQNKQQFSNKRIKLEINNNNNNNSNERNGVLGVMTSSQLDDDFDDDLNDETIDEKCSQALELHLAQTNQFNDNPINHNFNNNLSDHMIIGINFYLVFI
jgi:hypothetical protein